MRGEGMETFKPLPGVTNWLLNSTISYDPPGMPVERDTMHQIELLPNTEPSLQMLVQHVCS